MKRQKVKNRRPSSFYRMYRGFKRYKLREAKEAKDLGEKGKAKGRWVISSAPEVLTFAPTMTSFVRPYVLFSCPLCGRINKVIADEAWELEKGDDIGIFTCLMCHHCKKSIPLDLGAQFQEKWMTALRRWSKNMKMWRKKRIRR